MNESSSQFEEQSQRETEQATATVQTAPEEETASSVEPTAESSPVETPVTKLKLAESGATADQPAADGEKDADGDESLLVQIDQVLSEQADMVVEGDFQTIDELLKNESEETQLDPEAVESAAAAEAQTEVDGEFASVDQVISQATETPAEPAQSGEQAEEPAEDAAPEDEVDHHIQTIEEVLNLSQAEESASESEDESNSPDGDAVSVEELEHEEPTSDPTNVEAEPEPTKSKLPTLAIPARVTDLLEAANKPFDMLPMSEPARHAVGYIALGNCLMGCLLLIYALL